MIPCPDVSIRLDDAREAPGFPPLSFFTNGYADGNRMYLVDFLAATWEDAAEALEVEVELVLLADRHSTTWQEFEDYLDNDEEFDPFVTWGLDTGIAGLVLALSAAGCATTTSCRGHRSTGGLEHPFVRFYADPQRAAIIRTEAAEAGCGFGLTDEALAVWARSIPQVICLAHLLATRREEFDAMPRVLRLSVPDDEPAIHPLQGMLFADARDPDGGTGRPLEASSSGRNDG